jgi:hypothetical protein
MPGDSPGNQAEHTLRTREAYDRLAAVWSSTTDDGRSTGSWNGPPSGHWCRAVAEPQPSPEALRLFPDDLGPFAGVPLFIVYRLWLQPDE